jgi:outer membrane protein TolC
MRVAPLVVVAFLLRAVRPLAAEPPEDPLLARLVEEALARNPELAAVEHAVSAARERPGQTGSRPGPTIGLFYQNDGVAPSLGEEPMTMLGLVVGQEVPYPGKLGARRRIAESEAASASLERDRTRLGLVGAVTRAYYGLLLARGLGDLSQQHREVWRELQETARVRYAAAVGSQQELLRAQVEATRLSAVHAQHHAEARARLAELNALRAQPSDTPLETGAALRLAPEPREAAAWVQWFGERSPELKSAALAVERAEQTVELARLEGKPDFSLQGGVVNRGGLPPMWQASGTVLLSSRGRARSAVAEAQARLAAERARRDAVEARIRMVVDQRLALLRAAEEIEKTYREGLLPQGEVAVESAVARYAAGEGTQAGVLDAVAAILEDRTDHLRLLVTHASERSRLEEASLEPPTGIDSLLPHGRSGMAGAASMPSRALPPSAAGSPTQAQAGARSPMSMR